MEDNNAKNYFEVVKKLKEFEYKLVQQYKKWTDVTLLGLEIKSYIWDIPELKKEYLKKITFFQKNVNSEKYLKKANENYLKLQEVTNKIVQVKKYTKLFYKYVPKMPFEECIPLFCMVKADKIGSYTQNSGIYSTVNDNPGYYVYRSVMLQFLSSNNAKTIDLINRNLVLKSSIKSFYTNINPEYTVLDIPYDIEFFISSINTISSPFEFDCCIYIISLLYVVRYLEIFVINKIGNEYFGNKNSEIQRIFYDEPDLTSQEKLIYNFINDEITLKDIEVKFSISNSTVNSHLKNISNKLGYQKAALKSIQKHKRNILNS